MKKYKGWEIAKLISEGKLEGRKIEWVSNSGSGNLPYMVSKDAIWDIGYEREAGNSLLTDAISEYIVLQEPISFMDCVASEGWVRVEHELTSKLKPDGNYVQEFKNGECIPFAWVMFYLSSELENEELRTIIEEGKWYLEEAEDGEM